MVVFEPTFFSSEDSFLCDVCGEIIFFLEALWDPEAEFVIIPVGARLLVALGDLSISLRLSVVMPIYSCICVEDM